MLSTRLDLFFPLRTTRLSRRVAEDHPTSDTIKKGVNVTMCLHGEPGMQCPQIYDLGSVAKCRFA